MASRSSGKIRLLIVSTTLSRGGAERDASNFANHLDRECFSVDLALMRPVVDYPVSDDVGIHDLGKQRLLDNLTAIYRLRRLLSGDRYDIVMSALSATSFLTLIALLVLRKPPFWIARVDIDPLQLDLTETCYVKRKVKALLQRLAFNRADSLLTNSHGSRDGILRVAPQSADKIRVMYNPVDAARIERMSAKPPKYVRKGDGSDIQLVSVARLELSKDISTALRAMAQLVASGMNLTYTLCGSGTDEPRLRSLASELGIADRVIFAGFIDNPYAELKQADIFILSSKLEGLPNALIEAQLLGIPAIATDCRSGPSELIEPGTTGFLVPVGDPVSMADAIRILALDDKLRVQFGEAAAQRMGKLFNQEKGLEEFQEYLAALV